MKSTWFRNASWPALDLMSVNLNSAFSISQFKTSSFLLFAWAVFLVSLASTSASHMSLWWRQRWLVIAVTPKTQVQMYNFFYIIFTYKFSFSRMAWEEDQGRLPGACTGQQGRRQQLQQCWNTSSNQLWEAWWPQIHNIVCVESRTYFCLCKIRLFISWKHMLWV